MQIYNSLTRKKELFIPLNDKKVTMYVCGITPYDTTHLGHAFTYIFFDVVYRYLTHKGFKVTYTQNVTDINDRDNDLLKRAQEKNLTWQELGNFWTEKFLHDMKSLNWIFPTNYIKASESISLMIDIIQKLLKNNIAYIVNGSVYLDTNKKDDFGKLSRFSKEKMLEIAKNFEEDISNPEKNHPLDITLWRETKPTDAPHIPFFDSPFGKGRPGWHIECSAMAIGTLGERIDIHGGGKDLIYPHHESEIAQSEGATNKIPFAKYWMHTGTVSYRGQKMSKSKGNLVMVSDLLKKYSPNAIRYLLLSHYYREDWEFTEMQLDLAEKKVNSVILNGVKNLDSGVDLTPQNDEYEFIAALEGDLNTPLALHILEEKKLSTKALSILGFTV